MGVTGACVAGGLAVALTPGLRGRVVAPSLDLVLDTLTTIVALSVAALGWIRARQRDGPAAQYQSAAFLVLGTANGAQVVLALTGLDARAGATLAAPTQGPLYVFMLAHLLAGGLLVIGGLAERRHLVPRHRARVLGASWLLAIAILALLGAPAAALPDLAVLAAPAGGPSSGEALTLLGALMTAGAAILCLWAAALSREQYRRDGAIGDAFLSVGLVVATFAQIAFVRDPGTYTGVVTGADGLRLVFDLILLVGIQAQMQAGLGALRRANLDLERLRVIEGERAGQAERIRLSRELHDGLAQSLWLAKLKAGRLSAIEGLGPEASELTEELESAIEAGLVEAQQAVAALRLSGAPSSTLPELLARTIDEFTDRFGLRAEFNCDDDLPAVSSQTQVEALRIIQEALTNVRRHADATMVRVRVSADALRLTMSVADNGRGFDPLAVGDRAFGLASMRERAALIGGELQIASAPASGTMIRLVTPLLTPDAAGSVVA